LGWFHLPRNCHLRHVIEGKIEGKIKVMGRRGRRPKNVLDDLQEKRGYVKLKEKTLDRTLWESRLKRLWTALRQTKEGIISCHPLILRSSVMLRRKIW
jgi:hypothetical protein